MKIGKKLLLIATILASNISHADKFSYESFLNMQSKIPFMRKYDIESYINYNNSYSTIKSYSYLDFGILKALPESGIERFDEYNTLIDITKDNIFPYLHGFSYFNINTWGIRSQIGLIYSIDKYAIGYNAQISGGITFGIEMLATKSNIYSQVNGFILSTNAINSGTAMNANNKRVQQFDYSQYYDVVSKMFSLNKSNSLGAIKSNLILDNSSVSNNTTKNMDTLVNTDLIRAGFGFEVSYLPNLFNITLNIIGLLSESSYLTEYIPIPDEHNKITRYKKNGYSKYGLYLDSEIYGSIDRFSWFVPYGAFNIGIGLSDLYGADAYYDAVYASSTNRYSEKGNFANIALAFLVGAHGIF